MYNKINIFNSIVFRQSSLVQSLSCARTTVERKEIEADILEPNKKRKKQTWLE